MTRGLSRSLLALAGAALLLAPASAAGPAGGSAVVLQRFLAADDPAPAQFRALRHLEAHNDKFEKSAWMNVWTEADASGFRYTIVGEDGADYIRSKVFRATLDTERKMWAAGDTGKARFTTANYAFEERGSHADGTTSLTLKPRRKDVLLVDGSIFINPEDGELVRLEGQLSKAPSFWTRRVEIVRWYQRIGGIRVPTAVESVANVRIAGVSTFRMQYEYESINGQHVGNPQPTTFARASTVVRR
jgi:hypothetical protein